MRHFVAFDYPSSDTRFDEYLLPSLIAAFSEYVVGTL